MLRLKEFAEKIKTAKDENEEKYIAQTQINAIRISFQNCQITFRVRNVAKLIFLDFLGYKHGLGKRQCKQLVGCRFLIQKQIGYLGLAQLFMGSNVQLAEIINQELMSGNNKRVLLALTAISNLYFPKSDTDSNLVNAYCYFQQGLCRALSQEDLQIKKKAIYACCQAMSYNGKIAKTTGTIQKALMIQEVKKANIDTIFWLTNSFCLLIDQENVPTNFFQTFSLSVASFNKIAMQTQFSNIFRYQMIKSKQYVLLKKIFQKYKNTGKQVGKLIKQVCSHSYKLFTTLLQNGQFTERLLEFCTLQRYFELLIVYLKDSELIYESIRNILSPLVSTNNFLTYYHCIQALNSIKLLLSYSFINQKQTQLVQFTVRNLTNPSEDARFCAIQCLFAFVYPNGKPPNQYIVLERLCKMLQQAKMKPKLRYLSLVQFLFIYMERKAKPIIDYAFNRLSTFKSLQNLSIVNLILPGKLQEFDSMIIRTVAHLIQNWHSIKKQFLQKNNEKSVMKSSMNHNVSQSYLNFQKVSQFDCQSFDFELSQLLVSLMSQRVDIDQETILFMIPNIAKLGNNQHVQQILMSFTHFRSQRVQQKTYIALEQLKKNQFFDSRCLKSKIDESNLSRQQLIKKGQSYQLQQQYKILSQSMRKDSEQWENLNLNKSDSNDDEVVDLTKQTMIEKKETQMIRKGPVVPVKPIKISIFLRSTGYNVIQLGTHRILEVLFYSGKDDRSKDDYITVTERAIKWQTDPQGIIEVNIYGRLNTLKAGNVELKVTSLTDTEIYDTKRITVVQKSNSKFIKLKKLQVDYKGTPIPQCSNLQKIVKRFTNIEANTDQSIPNQIKRQLFNNEPPKYRIVQGQIQWKIVGFADGSSGKYVIRTDNSLPSSHRDKIQYFMGSRYLPGDGKSPKSIDDDGSNGVWVIGMNGDITHIQMQKINYKQKAQRMSLDTEKYVLRHGLASGSDWNGFQWVSGPSDNDGLWTSLYGAGQLMRYATIKTYNFPAKQVAQARKSALRSLKAVLFLGNVSGRDGICKSTIRFFPNTVIGAGDKYTKQYLKKGKIYAVDNYVGSPYDSISFFGIDAGKTTQGYYVGGKYRYSLTGIYEQDWAAEGQEPALTEKTLKGYLSRTFCITPLQKTTGGLCFQRNEDGTQTVVSGAQQLIDYGPNDHPILNVGNLPIPQILKDVLFEKGVQYGIKDINYKGDVSYDQVIGHLFIYKIGFDIMDQKDKEQKQLKELIKQTVINYAQHLLDNGYTVCDATGLATRWGKAIRDFFNSDYLIQEGNMHGVILLMTFKLAYYMTNDHKWQDEYVFLCQHENIRLLDYCTVYWKRSMYLNLNGDNSLSKNLRHLDQNKNPSEAQMLAHRLYCIHFSDQQMAMMVYYLAFQLETDPKYLQKYQQGLDGWWISVSRSQNPFWYYIYQLSKPSDLIKDAYGNNILETAAWQLARHPIDTIKWPAYFNGSRPDVLRDFSFSVDPKVVIGRRTSESDEQNANFAFNFKILSQYDPKNIHQIKILPHDQRSVHKFNGTTFDQIEAGNPNAMEPATTYTLPYWFGVYHKMLELKYQ